MPELPDIESYIDALNIRIVGRRLIRLDLASPFLLRTVEPSPAAAEGKRVRQIERVGKRIAIGLEQDVWLVLHLMIAGRLHWHARAPKRSRRVQALLEFESGTLSLTEAGSKRRASLHIVVGWTGLAALDPGGLEPLEATSAEFIERLQRRNHTLKRALTDPKILSGIGNAYSDEILHRAGLSPVKQTRFLSQVELTRLYRCTRDVLIEWRRRLAPGDVFPERVTAFREGMAVHGRYGQACPACGTSVQRIRYAANETNYCPRCQTSGKLLADRSLSRLLKQDWPRTIEELEERAPPQGNAKT